MAKDPRFDPDYQKNIQQKRVENKIAGNEISNNSILTNHIAQNAITSDKLADNSILSNHLTNGSITPEKLSSNWPVFAGSFAAYPYIIPDYSPYLNSNFNIGFTLNQTASSLTITQAGYYYIYAHQLVSTTGGVYLRIRKNGNTIVHAYSDSDTTYDLIASALIQCSVGTIIDFSYSGITTYSWTAPHSSVSCYFVRP